MVLKRNRLTVAELFAMKTLLDAGRSAAEIRACLHRPKSTVSAWLRRIREGLQVPPVQLLVRSAAVRRRAARRAARGAPTAGPNGAQNPAPLPLILDCRMRFTVRQRSFWPPHEGLRTAPQALVRVVLARNRLVWEVLDPGPRHLGQLEGPPGPCQRSFQRGAPEIWSRIAREVDRRYPLTYAELVAAIDEALQELRDRDLGPLSAFVRP